MTTRALLALASLSLSLHGCKHGAQGGAALGEPLTGLTRTEFNQRAQELFAPLFWRADLDHDGAPDEAEVLVLWAPTKASLRDYFAEGGAPTAALTELYSRMKSPAKLGELPTDERARQEAVRAELAQGMPTVIATDLSGAPAEERAVVGHLMQAASALEQLYARQLGTLELKDQVPADDLASKALFHRNQSPACAAPKTENDPACSALPTKTKPLSGLYPAALQQDPKFCERLAKEKNASELMEHFAAVVPDGSGFKSVPYQQRWPVEMTAVAEALEHAAEAVTSPSESAFKAYLSAAAKAFRDGDWEGANEAWAAMSATNSKWYLRVAPDEVYFEPCAWKAGFALNFSRINPDSLAWQEKLEPVKLEMEKALAALAGPPYQSRDVKFKLPDFIDVVLNAGDQRTPHGATIGQSLPNWGPVAAKGGRTVTMTNLYTDPDSQATLKGQMQSLFCSATAARASTDAKPAVMSVVLHEAAHNLGPSHEYKVQGREDDEVFGGPLASIMEELKAQTSALYFSEWLVQRGLLTQEEAVAAHVRDVAWGFGHISRGMYDGVSKRPKAYSQLASIQLGTLTKAGVLTWHPDEKAANGTDVGCYELDFAKWRGAVDALAARVLKAKGSGDRKDAEAMTQEFVDAAGPWQEQRKVITERWLRAPRQTFVYSVKH